MSSTQVTSFTTAAGDGYVDVDGLKITGVLLTPTSTEFNKLSGLTASSTQLNQYTITCSMADAGTAQSRFVVAPHAGVISLIYAVNSVANATTKTVITAKIATVLVTMPAFEITVTQAAGVVSSTVPTAARTVTAGQAIEIISDGGTDAVMPVEFSILITR